MQQQKSQIEEQFPIQLQDSRLTVQEDFEEGTGNRETVTFFSPKLNFRVDTKTTKLIIF